MNDFAGYVPATVGRTGTKVHMANIAGRNVLCGHVNSHYNTRAWRQSQPRATNRPVDCKKCLAIMARNAERGIE